MSKSLRELFLFYPIESWQKKKEQWIADKWLKAGPIIGVQLFVTGIAAESVNT